MSFLRQSLLLNLLYAFESGVGFLIDIGIAFLLGASVSSDALYAAWIIPQTIGRGLFQSVSHSLLGLYAEVHSSALANITDGSNALLAKQQLDELYGQILSIISIFGLVISLLLSLTSEWWIPLSIGGAHPTVQSTAISIAQILGCLPFFLALSETFRSIYYFEDHFALPSVFRIAGGIVTVALFSAGLSFTNVTGMAWAILIGALVELLLTWLFVYVILKRWIRFCMPTGCRLKQISTIAGIPMSGVMLLMLAATGERMIASLFGMGTITLVAYANRIITAIERFVFRGVLISVTKATLNDGLTNVASYMRIAIIFSIPVVLGLALLPPLLLPLIGKGSRFTFDASNQLAIILQFYAPAVIGLAVSRVPFGYVFALNKSRQIFGFYLVTAISLLLVEIVLFQLGMGASLFGIGYTIAMWGGFFYLYMAIDDRLSLSWRTVFIDWHLSSFIKGKSIDQ